MVNPETVDALHGLNRDFYRARAGEFSASRARPWPGWRRALEVYGGHASPRAGAAPRVLDLGCGNGRLAAFLAPRLAASHRYLGVDASLPLLAIARRSARVFPRARFALADLLAADWPLRRGGFTWVTAFGVLHHIAGGDNRRRFMARLGALVAPGGIATVSFWRFAERPRFRRRSVAWESVDERQLERGDHLLRWGSGDDLRYCHHVDDREARELAAASGMRPVAWYRSDGEGADLNLYLVLARSGDR